MQIQVLVLVLVLVLVNVIINVNVAHMHADLIISSKNIYKHAYIYAHICIYVIQNLISASFYISNYNVGFVPWAPWPNFRDVRVGSKNNNIMIKFTYTSS